MKRWILFGVKLAVAIGLVGYFVGGENFSAALDRLARLDLLLFASACGIFFLEVFLFTLRWALINNALGISLSPVATLKLCWIGLFFNQTLPSTFGGDAVRIWYVCRTGTSLTTAASSVLLDRILGLLMLTVLVAIMLPFTLPFIDSPVARNGLSLLAGGGIVCFIVLAILANIRLNISHRWRVTKPIGDILASCRVLARSPQNLVAILAIGIMMHALTAFAAWLISESIGGLITLPQAMALVPPVILAAAIPVSVAGWGIREGAMVVALGFIAVPEVDAASISVLLGLAIAAAGLPGGLVWISDKTHRHDMRNLDEAETRGNV